MDNILQEEAVIISCFLENPQITYELCDKYGIQSQDFSSYQQYFSVIVALYRINHVIDIKSVREQLLSLYNIEFDNNLLNKSDFVNLEGYCRRLKVHATKKHISRSLINVQSELEKIQLSDSLQDLYDPVIKSYNTIIDSIRDPTDATIPITAMSDELIAYFSEETTNIVSTGLPIYDKMIGGGLRISSMHMVEARPGVGKSFFALNVAYNIACGNTPVLLLDTELDKKFLATRLLSLMSGIPIDIIENKTIWRKNTKIAQYLTFVIKNIFPLFPIHYKYIGGLPLNHVLNICKNFVQQYQDRLPVVVYDYFLVSNSGEMTNTKLNETQIIGNMLNQLHDLVVRYEFPMLFFCQTNREGMGRVGSGTTAASDRYEWKASSKANLVVPKNDTPNCLELYVTKSRFGRVSSDPILLQKNLAIGKIDEIDESQQSISI